MKKIFLCALCVVALLLSACGAPKEYTQAQECFAAGDYEQAADLFSKCNDYEDSADMTLESKYLFAAQKLDNKEYSSAQRIYGELAEVDYKDSKIKLAEVDSQENYDAALDFLNSGNYTAAYKRFEYAGDYLDAKDYMEKFTVISVLKSINFKRTDMLGNTLNTNEAYGYNEQGQLSYVFSSNATLSSESPLIHAWQYNILHSCLANAEVYKYDDSGRVIGITGLFGASKFDNLDVPSGTTGYVVSFDYDEQGRISTENITTGIDQDAVILAYGENGELISAKLGRDSTPFLKYYYNENGDISRVVSNSDWYCEYNFDYTYSGDGKIAERKVTVSAGPSYTETYIYDKSGRILEINIDYDDANTLDVTLRYTYADVVIYQQ